jgi:uncharacterized membrane protein YsdA (DUF1294 family)
MFVKILLAYLLSINLLGFVLMGYDKRQAKHKAWRQSERSLLTIAALGGSLGVYMGSRVWRHKTKKQRFVRPFWAIVVVEVFLLALLGYFYA